MRRADEQQELPPASPKAKLPPATGAPGSRREAFGRAGVAGKALCKSAEAQSEPPAKPVVCTVPIRHQYRPR